MTTLLLLLSFVTSAYAGDPAPAPPPAPVSVPVSAPVKYAMSDTTGTIYVQVFKDPTTLAAGLSHDHVMKATGWTGSVTWDATNPATCAVDISIPVAKLEVDSNTMRAKVGYSGQLSDSDRSSVQESMLSSGQLDGSKYPNMTFKSSSCSGSGETIMVKGSLTIRGKAKEITVPMKISASATEFSAKGTFKAKHSDFGFTPFEALLGQLKNKDEMTFTVDVKGVPKG